MFKKIIPVISILLAVIFIYSMVEFNKYGAVSLSDFGHIVMGIILPFAMVLFIVVALFGVAEASLEDLDHHHTHK